MSDHKVSGQDVSDQRVSEHDVRTVPVPSEGGLAATGCTAVGSRFRSMAVAGPSSVVSVRPSSGPDHRVVVPAAPDAGLARRLTAGFRHVSWVRIDVTGPTPRCEVGGATRRPRRQPLPLAAALALADAGVPTTVRHRLTGA